MEQWASDRIAARQSIEGLEDGIERLAVILTMAEEFPGETGELCPLLVVPDARKRCETINARPHLAEDVSPTPIATVQSPWGVVLGPGVLPVLPDLLANVDSSRVSCGAGETDIACRTAAAVRAGEVRDVDGLLAACAGLSPGKWQDECIFQGAEAIANPIAGGELDPGRYEDAARMCLGSGDFAPRCLTHVQWEAVRHAPAAHQQRARDWAKLGQVLDGAVAGVDFLGPEVQAWLRSRFWGAALHISYLKATDVTGAPLANIPTDMAVHAWDAAAWRLLQLEGDRDRSLKVWGVRVRMAMAKGPSAGREQIGADRRGIALLWGTPQAKEAALPTMPYLGGGRRTVHPSPATDGLISILEGAARAMKGRGLMSLLDAGMVHEDAQVRWTALRLSQSVLPGRSILPILLADPDPLVRARARLSARRRPERAPGKGDGE